MSCSQGVSNRREANWHTSSPARCCEAVVSYNRPWLTWWDVNAPLFTQQHRRTRPFYHQIRWLQVGNRKTLEGNSLTHSRSMREGLEEGGTHNEWDDWQLVADRSARILWMRREHANTHFTHTFDSGGKSPQLRSLSAGLTTSIVNKAVKHLRCFMLTRVFVTIAFIVPASSHWVGMALATTWRWRIIATWICERTSKEPRWNYLALLLCFLLVDAEQTLQWAAE